MFNQSLPKNAKAPSSSSSNPAGMVFNRSNSAAVYRSLELPLPQSVPSPLQFSSLSQKSSPQSAQYLFQQVKPQSKNVGEVSWSAPTGPPAQGLFVPSRFSFTVKNVVNVAEQVAQVLLKHEVDFTLSASFEWTCTVFTNFVETCFVLRYFSSSILDCQRESGCACVFQSLFDFLQQELGQGEAGGCKKLKSFKPLALPEEMKVPPPTTPLPHPEVLLTASFLDVQIDSLSTFDRLVEDHQVELNPLCQGMLLKNLLTSPSSNVKQLAAHGMNLDHSLNTLQVKEEEVRTLVTFLLDEKEQVEVRRQVGLLLTKLQTFSPMAKATAMRISSATIISRDPQLNNVMGNLQGLLKV